ncbi:hypothetical protein BDV23DRAFT_187785 [Aspergillus alliaceus]|uniref:Uncharacterized protein n=1 Tax=Petromyces alliaceus TaxID=209559 RepID=A0A5N7BVL7_PETAA|nr:hypothetical protein BDV23DRAFT_187785 [Aspergillus alliaceus]
MVVRTIINHRFRPASKFSSGGLPGPQSSTVTATHHTRLAFLRQFIEYEGTLVASGALPPVDEFSVPLEIIGKILPRRVLVKSFALGAAIRKRRVKLL